MDILCSLKDFQYYQKYSSGLGWGLFLSGGELALA
jgi:hypothetical protein